ncbi:hypothetical protein HRW18_05445 [Streptomyces lunaelactis]|uniref:hypothetical protein n=1 Tax=Streptomyces lunaelactis TaxID=1535768 RepID=UPI0015859B5F|nr:hypothetical protein [Streptomyces lunaelactis]NUK07467.1 hypothetical protein [Streptomyces lunaelactis]
MGVVSDLLISAAVRQTKALDLTTVSDPLDFKRAVHLESGTTVGKADKVFHDRRTLSASATEDLDLAGVLLDAYGVAITFVKIKGLFIAADAANTNNVVVGNAAATAWAALLGATGTLTIRPGTTVGVTAGATDATGYAVAAGSTDLLKVANSAGGTGVTYDIVIIGTSA